MRGGDVRSEALFSYVSCEARVPLDHPLRPIRKIVDEALGALSAEFEALYAKFGRPSIAPEKLLRALLLQAFYSVRSERQLMEQLGYNLLFRWFVGLSLDAVVWDVTVSTKNRDRLIAGDMAADRIKALLSREHFSVDDDRSVGQHEKLSPEELPSGYDPGGVAVVSHQLRAATGSGTFT